ncbi:(deoxy)nucleoside triphosphate pyrophosphohydrolase [Dictyobacter formicarum]|nr:(deoxy)nucleoside triphosphate pyrophosphohydrolase [Dictyobacter formicarum]
MEKTSMKTVTAAILMLNGKILIARRKKGDAPEHKWEFPGGKIEPGETPEQCLKREMMEEFGVEVEVKDFFCSAIYRYQHIEIELLAYHTVYLEGEFQLNAHAEIKWITLEELKDYDFAEADIPIAHKLYA